MVAVPLWLKSDRTRRIVALVCFFLVEIIVLINLILSSDHPTSALCWSQLSSGDVNLYLGLTKIRGCIDGYGCQSASLSSVEDSYGGGTSCATAGGWVIASYVIVLVLLIGPLFLLLHCGCVRVPYPRIIGTLTSSTAFVWTIVAVSKWFEGCHNGLDCKSGGCSKKPGYSVALAILTILLAFIGMVFYWWRALRPQVGGVPPPKGQLVDGNAETSDGYAPTSPAGGQFGGYSTPTVSSNTYSMGLQALSNPHVQQLGMAAASNPQVQQWGAQQAQQSYGYGGYR